ncbi:phosphoesterase HXTX [Chitinophaga parva]|uniref:Phosphoesterase HXTX n=1 Tax=Chitinophaga parva TaxID=2169414 RepID=A0A2T7BCJ8_9BACT|nr:2'-5' RNA ligase family protein [Chitinophaga parva]PUZ22740.1 phosphoesterase HXTX [Chitinophaga parva]
MAQETPPLIVTLELDGAAHQFFTAQRTRYFPAHTNYLEAHLTLFHHLPGNNAEVMDILAREAAGPPFSLAVTGLHNMGNGVAYTLQSDHLQRLHRRLQEALRPWLLHRDLQPCWPHITIMNKVTAYKALRTWAELSGGFRPFRVEAWGLGYWHYHKGAWEAAGNMPFTQPGGSP